MNLQHIEKIAIELKLQPKQVSATAELFEDDATIPFIARYRKEVTGSLDEVEIASIRDRLIQLEELDKRREAILKSLEERELLTDELKVSIETAETMTELEDIYLPYRPKRRTRATIAKEKGLEPLAILIFAQGDIDPYKQAVEFVDAEKGVENTEQALSGARDIIAEWISEDKEVREKIRGLFVKTGTVTSKIIEGKEEEGNKYKDYFEWNEAGFNAPSHRILALFRGENEEFLRLELQPKEEDALAILDRHFVRTANDASEQVKIAAHDSFRRLLSLSMETEFRSILKEKADKEAINVFSDNLRQLLLAPPLGQKRILAIDPGFRTGCKVVCLDSQGKLLHNETIYPTGSEKQNQDAQRTLIELCKQFEIEFIAIGNGTAGRETETLVKSMKFDREIPIVMVNESGASIYSASEIARTEFPDQDITVRGSVSIGRRLMDPLAELVKIDPKSIGVGQYQHDVNQTMLKQKLDDVVVSCVNKIGVELNTASKQLLTYVSGVGPKLAQSIVEFRNENGPFGKRNQLKEVPRLGGKAFEQCAGFLRIRNGENPLDASAVHPESYHIVENMAKDLNCTVAELIINPELQKKIDINKYVNDKVGLPTLEDIRAELAKPGRDPRQMFEIFNFADGIEKIGDLKQGMKLPGVITNITAFGVFVDIGVHQDGLVHISQLANRFIQNPADVFKVHQRVTVTVVSVDAERKRISLTMKDETTAAPVKKDRPKKKKEDMDEKLRLLVEKFKKT